MMSEKRALKLHADDPLEANFPRSRTRCGFTPASTALRELVIFFILNIFLVIKNTFQVENWPVSIYPGSTPEDQHYPDSDRKVSSAWIF